jgi:hypothetical protein
MRRSHAQDCRLYQPKRRPALTPDAGTQRKEAIMKHQQEMFVHWKKDHHGGTGFSFFSFDMSTCGYVLIGKQVIEFEVPDDFNPVPIQVAMLEAEKEKAMQEFNERVSKINEEISKLTCLEYTA